ncbi:MAG TPA: 4-hydroxythreonine-4-phosphate dehydrogenase PdxA [Thermoplasmataceae archaeon]|nr:4-hydroxythreonine-4-phosphate dehydrogenase PdxA [Thermoplasmataceae archaeon]
MRIGITAGDPAGIGPEIVAKSVREFSYIFQNIVIYCDLHDFRLTWKTLFNSEIPDSINIHDVGHDSFFHGKPSSEAGGIAFRSIESAVHDAIAGITDVIVTAPINKESFVMSGSKFIDHTVMIKDLTRSPWLETVFETGNLRVSFLTKHIPFSEILSHLNHKEILHSIERADLSLRLLGVKRRKIAVAALNPHAGDGGILGTEDIGIIMPAIEQARKSGYDVTGPVPADSVFHRAASGEFDIVVSLYHDQGHIAAKTLDFHGTVSMNIGAPFLRTSVDHGTAYDIAGKWIADHSSMKHAIMKALKYAEEYKKNYRKLEREIIHPT